MTRPVQIKTPPRRQKCKTCGAKVSRLYTGRALSIVLDGHGKDAIEHPKVHRCGGKP